ncbi:class I SAM-dependent methyltransferase [Thiohalomonas denitrificans]|uniref:Ribosomal RNA small subunit methyltransferase J n=1 Tax=Thiohalomonas denitrificans TaxID=415747 RepID=A0A1G5QCB7_9GAMM|nr:class I SAM-dependent methyltransferase [Thiohalomonas denitrificans]SCZ59001.1 16S rRNA (guanine1516-N2)-methyltransferase [Thiohalomonas denitrificans]
MDTVRLCDIPLVCEAAERCEEADDLAHHWGLRRAGAGDEPLKLFLTGERLELRESGPGAPGPVFVDFVGGAAGHRRRFGGGRGQPIAKAVGLKKGRTPSVIDATAGLGRDAFVLASLGCAVRLVEQSAPVAALLEDGLRRARKDPATRPIAERMSLVQADAVEYLRNLPGHQCPDVVYLDPMYPPRRSRALVKKEMQLFHRLIGTDPNAQELLPAALECARKRVVVKRPDYAPPLADRSATLTFATKRNRFDVYIIPTMKG